MSETIPVTSTLASGISIVFDVPHTEAEDEEEEMTAFEFWTLIVG